MTSNYHGICIHIKADKGKDERNQSKNTSTRHHINK
jgi:hypothetical protein